MKKKNKKSGSSKKVKDDAPEPSTAEGAEQPAASAPKDTTQPESKDDAIDDKPVEASAEDDKMEDTPAADATSLAQQSKLRSTSFRAASGTVPLSPGAFSPDGDTAPDIYRKHVARIEELEKEAAKLGKDLGDAEKRWKKAEDELADLREAEGDAAPGGDEQLVSTIPHLLYHSVS